MEENGQVWELNSVSFTGLVLIKTMRLFVKTSQYVSSLSSSPLFSTIITLYTLILLYFPYLFLRILLSPVLIITELLLLTLLRLGATLKHENQNQLITTTVEITSDKSKDQFISSNELYHNWVDTEESDIESETEMGFDPNPYYEDFFLHWNVRAPLEVIYEEYEGEEEDEDRNEKDPNSNQVVEIERHPSLSLYYPESDSDSSSEGVLSSTGGWDLQENLCFRWDEDQDYREGLIEIALDGNKTGSDFHVEEDNLIEIDISPTRNDDFLDKKWRFSDELSAFN